MSKYYEYDGKDGFMAKCRVVWNPKHPDKMTFLVSADEMTDENGEKAGMWLTFEGHNIKSANFDPFYFNRCVRWLKMHNLPHPPEAPLKSRRLADRLVTIFGRA